MVPIKGAGDMRANMRAATCLRQKQNYRLLTHLKGPQNPRLHGQGAPESSVTDDVLTGEAYVHNK